MSRIKTRKWIVRGALVGLLPAVIAIAAGVYAPAAQTLIKDKERGLALWRPDDEDLLKWLDEELGSRDLVVGYRPVRAFQPFTKTNYHVLYAEPGSEVAREQATALIDLTAHRFQRGVSRPPARSLALHLIG